MQMRISRHNNYVLWKTTTHRAAIEKCVHVHGPLTTQADEDLQDADDGDADESRLIVVIQTVEEYPGINPHELGQDEGQHVAVEQKLAWIV